MTVTAEPASRAIYCPPPASFSASSFSKNVLSVTGVAIFPAPDHVQHGGVDPAVHRQEEVFRLEEGGDQMDGFVVDQQRPEKRLLGLKVARRRPGPLLDLLAGATVAHAASGMARRTASALPMRMSAVISPRPHRTSWLSCRWRRSASWSTS